MECLAFLLVVGVVAVAAIGITLGKVKCPYCHRRVDQDAGACPRCGRDLEPEFWKRQI
jgi:predicted amidophosphoribosyltransferase